MLSIAQVRFQIKVLPRYLFAPPNIVLESRTNHKSEMPLLQDVNGTSVLERHICK